MIRDLIIYAFAVTTLAMSDLSSPSLPCTSSVCHDSQPEQAHVLLQAHQKRSKATLATNPSGAAAPLDEVGYSAVADRCCQAEMQVFIQRHVTDQGLEVCDANGLAGIVPFHSCEAGPQTFDKLTADLLNDTGKRCTWVATIGNCKPRPADCQDYSGMAPLADCGCHRSKASKVDFSAGTVTTNNLAGKGPSGGAEEIRYSNVGTSETGQKFDLVVTALSAYNPINSNLNGISNEFGVITQRQASTTDFRFSFMLPGTNTPVQLTEVHMAIFDLDGSTSTGIEVAASKGYKGYVTDVTPNVAASRLPDGRTKFSASGKDANIVNPSKTSSLTAAQRQGAVMYFYADVSSFDLTFGIEGGPYARNLFFAFTSTLNDRCAP